MSVGVLINGAYKKCASNFQMAETIELEDEVEELQNTTLKDSDVSETSDVDSLFESES